MSQKFTPPAWVTPDSLFWLVETELGPETPEEYAQRVRETRKLKRRKPKTEKIFAE